MFKRILIADDLDSINQGILMTANRLGIPEVMQVQYCDDAYLKIKKGIRDGQPFELLVTDLSFKSDHRAQKYSSGEELIAVIRKEHPELRIIVYSIEDRPGKVRKLFTEFGIHGFVVKSRKGLKELQAAISQAASGGRFLSPQIEVALQQNDGHELTDYDIELMRHLSNGLSQDEISRLFKSQGISPSSLSSIEKRLNKLRIQFGANNAIHLVAMVKDLGIV